MDKRTLQNVTNAGEAPWVRPWFRLPALPSLNQVCNIRHLMRQVKAAALRISVGKKVCLVGQEVRGVADDMAATTAQSRHDSTPHDPTCKRTHRGATSASA